MNSHMRIGAASPTWRLACLCLLLLGSLSLPSCKKEYFETDRIKDDAVWNPEWAVPLIKSTVTVPEVLGRFEDQDVIVVDSTGILALRYFGNIFSVSAENVVLLQNQTNTQSFPLSPTDASTLALGGSVSIPSTTFNFPLDMSNFTSVPEIHSITFKGGSLDVTLSTAYTYPASVNVVIAGLTPATPITATNSGGVVSIPLAGKTWDLTQGAPFNNIRFTVSGSINGSSGTGAPGQMTSLNVAVNNPAFSLLLGDIKQQTFNVPASEVRIRFFENQQDGDIHWADPRVKPIFNNFIGADLGFSNVSLDFGTSSGPSGVLLCPTRFNGQTLGHNTTVGAGFPTTLDINRSNCTNLVGITDSEPTKLFYSLDLTTNPAGGSNVNWLQDTSKIGLDMEVYLPFDGTAVDFAKSDTAAVQIFPIEGDIQEIESVTFRLTIDNGFPADAKAQVYFYDSTLVDPNFVGTPVPIDSLFPNARAVVFASPTPDGNGIVDQTQKVRTVLNVTLTREMLEKLEARKFTQLVSRGWIDTFDAGSRNVQIYNNYEMDLYLGVMVKAKFNVQF